MAMATVTIPEELLMEIMVWLPVKSLKRFRCLSKSLCSLIDSPDFIKLHICNSPNNFNRKLIFQSLNNFHVFDVNLNLDNDNLRLRKPIPSLPDMEIRGYCNGLLLLSSKNLMYVSSLQFSLWNPSTGQFRDLSGFRFKFGKHVLFRSEIGPGLVYDDSTDEYKVIFVVRTDIEFEFNVWIYELKSSNWRMTTSSFPRVEYRHNKNFREEGFNGIGHFTDGILYLTYCIYGWRMEIMAFDVKTETLFLVPQPAVCSISAEETKLHLLEGCLCISYFSRPNSPFQAVDLYMRKKDGVADVFTWTKLFSVTGSLFPDIIWPDTSMNVLGYSKRGDKILFGLGMLMFSYDVKEKSFAKVEFDINCRLHTPILCLLESLVSLGVGA